MQLCQGGDVTHLLELITAMVEAFSLRGVAPREQFITALLAALNSLQIWHDGLQGAVTAQLEWAVDLLQRGVQVVRKRMVHVWSTPKYAC